MTSHQNLSVLRQSAEQSPDDINRWLDLCAEAEKLGDYTQVLNAGEQIIRLAPDKPQSHYIRGMALHRLDRIEEAANAYKRVLALDDNYLDGWVNFGECMRLLNRIPEAEEACHRAIAVSGQGPDQSDYGSHYLNLALIELLKGDLASGFKHYPARFKAITHKKRAGYTQPFWRGEDLRGKAILVVVDQGHGDTLMMARYLPLLKERGARVIMQVQPGLVSLLNDWNGVDQVLDASRDTPAAFDYHVWEFDLPRIFETTLKTVPAKIPYLPIVSPDRATYLPDDGEPRIGVAWAGNPDHRDDHRRSIPLANFKSLFDVSGFQFFNLNRDMRPGDAELIAQLPVTDLAPRLSDFAATARFIYQFDLIITCDTAIAHLAGGMGKPVWILLPFAPSWHWMMEREDSPWYPTARLFRQKIRGDWDEVMKRVAGALTDWSPSR